jgi:hypothetical protein
MAAGTSSLRMRPWPGGYVRAPPTQTASWSSWSRQGCSQRCRIWSKGSAPRKVTYHRQLGTLLQAIGLLGDGDGNEGAGTSAAHGE